MWYLNIVASEMESPNFGNFIILAEVNVKVIFTSEIELRTNQSVIEIFIKVRAESHCFHFIRYHIVNKIKFFKL